MNGHSGRTRVFDASRELGGVDGVLVPTRPHLHCDGNLHPFRHGGDNAGGMRGLAHQAAPGVVFGDLRHRATHVHVDDVGAQTFDDLGSLGHRDRIAAENLDGYRPLFFGVFGVLERAIDPPNQPLGADHLGDDQSAAPLPLDQSAERGVGHARHRGDDKRRGERYRPDFHRSSSIPARNFAPAALRRGKPAGSRIRL